ncbi:MFS transporter [Phenylobacterium sp.]|jgi:MFS family permease|uniref:spinster family MFS transporter n=1 Tax=Phenylobacterium sp. TaxID=1871053 RepID=UPI002F425A09
MDARRTAGFAAGEAQPLTIAQRNLMLALLTMVGFCGAIDRSIISTVLEPIKHEFGLSDSQLGMASGLAFAVAHAVVAIPLGMLADRVNRRKLIAVCLVGWSAMTALCGLGQNFAQLILARMGVGAGEAGGQAATLSTISDLFPAEKRATAISIYYLSGPFGLMFAGGVGGLTAATYGWRAAMLVAAAPGVVLALLLLLVGKDTPREGSPRLAPRSDAPGLGKALRFIASQRSLLHLMAALAIITLVVTGQGAFGYAFFMRYHHMDLRELGPLLGVSSGAIGLASILTAGLISDRLGRRDPRLRLWVVVATLVAGTPIVMTSYVIPGPLALPLYLTHVLLLSVWLGPGIATAQNLAQPRIRSTVASIVYVVNGLIGFGLGPVVVGALSDGLAAQLGAGSLRAALLVVTALGFWAALHFHLATRSLTADLARAAA